MLRNKYIIIGILLISLLFTTGCWDKVEIDQRAFVFALAVDKDKAAKEEKDNKIKVMMFTPIPAKIQGGQVDAFTSEKSTGRNVAEAVKNLNTSLSRVPFFGQTKLLLLGENILKDSEKFKELLDYIEREPDISRSMKVVAVKGDIENLTKIEVKFEKVFAIFILGILNNAEQKTEIKSLSLNGLLGKISDGKGTAVIPCIKIKNNKADIDSLTLIENYAYKGSLRKEFIQPYEAIAGNLKHGKEFIEYNNVYVPYNITSAERKVNVSEENDKVKFNIGITLEGDLEQYKFGEKLKQKDMENLKLKTEEKFKKELMDLTKYFQNDVGHDFLKFNEYTYKYNNKLYKKYENNWDSAFKNAIVEYDVKIFIRRKGPEY